MPRISEFYGIAIYMYFTDHAPPHFHAIYGDHEAEVSINSPRILDGELPTRAKRFVLEWARIRRGELQADWERARQGAPLLPIAPLN